MSIVINNAGIGRASSSLAPDAIDAARAEMETNFFGPLRVREPSHRPCTTTAVVHW